jgi:two-component system sensor histidine kinase RegB
VDAFVYAGRLDDERSMVVDAVLKQAIFNLLDNALEASPHWVGLGASQDDATLALSVCDDGPGFSPEIIEQLGKPYNSSKGRDGGGLGLFLVYNVVRKLGGNVTVGNRAEGGAEVKVHLPLAALSVEDHEHE